MPLIACRFLLPALAAAVTVLCGGPPPSARAADPVPHGAGQSTIQFAFADDAPMGTMRVRMGRNNSEAWEQPAYPGAHLTFTLPPGRYAVEVPGDPVLHFVEAPPGGTAIVAVRRGGAGGYEVADERRIPSGALPEAETGAAPLHELGPSVSFAITPGPGSGGDLGGGVLSGGSTPPPLSVQPRR
jgi:hypothetical protein